jgi:hypothetical protein
VKSGSCRKDTGRRISSIFSRIQMNNKFYIILPSLVRNHLKPNFNYKNVYISNKGKTLFFSTLHHSSQYSPSLLDKLDFNCGQAAYAVSLFAIVFEITMLIMPLKLTSFSSFFTSIPPSYSFYRIRVLLSLFEVLLCFDCAHLNLSLETQSLF